MKAHLSLTLLALLAAMTSCQYSVPLSKPQELDIDIRALGRWEEVPSKKAGKDKKPGRIIVVKFTEKDYLVHFSTDTDGGYFRAYPLKIGGMSCVQFKLLADGKGIDLTPPGKELCNVFNYEIQDDGTLLVVKQLNEKLVSSKLRKSADLKAAFLKHKDNPELWKGSTIFKRLAPRD